MELTIKKILVEKDKKTKRILECSPGVTGNHIKEWQKDTDSTLGTYIKDEFQNKWIKIKD